MNLIHRDLFVEDMPSAVSPLGKMLQALDCLAFKSIVHRDIKLEILSTTPPTNGYIFRLVDFGLCNAIIAPE